MSIQVGVFAAVFVLAVVLFVKTHRQTSTSSISVSPSADVSSSHRDAH